MESRLWTLFLPKRSDARVLVYGDVCHELEETLSPYLLQRPPSDSTFDAVVRLPTGPRLRDPTLRHLLQQVGERGILIWIGRRDLSDHPILCDASGERGCARRVMTLRVTREALEAGGEGVTPKPLTGGKLDFLAEVVRTLLSYLPENVQSLFSSHVNVVAPADREIRSWIHALLAQQASTRDSSHPGQRLLRLHRTKTGKVVGKLRDPAGELTCLHTTLERASVESLLKEAKRLREIRTWESIPHATRTVIPTVLREGRYHNRGFLLTTWLPGVPGSTFFFHPARRRTSIDTALRWITRLHEQTLRTRPRAERYVDLARRVLAEMDRQADSPHTLKPERIAAYLRSRLSSYPQPVVFGHGDFWLGNILYEDDGRRIAGVLDWEASSPKALPLHDVLHLVLQQKGMFTRFDLHGKLRRLVTCRLDETPRSQISQYLRRLDLPAGSTGAVVILYWLRLLEGRKSNLPFTMQLYQSVCERLSENLESQLDKVGYWLREAP